ncbi:MAG: Fibronectin type domain protein [Rhodocyclales bacterium]|nr:Fibronectin type domain protein [Rhodocyclales bacterium]
MKRLSLGGMSVGLSCLALFLPIMVSAAQLTIADGVVVKFGPDTQLLVRDQLVNGKGTTLTSQKDDTVGGQTNALPQSPVAGDWRGVRIEKSTLSFGAATLSDMTLRYAGGLDNGNPGAALTILGLSPTLKYLQITDSTTGLRLLQNASPAITGSSFQRNATGLETDGNSAPSIGGSQFVQNTAYGIFNKTPTTVIQATSNWWGHPSGPKDAVGNPGGLGNAVSTGVNYGSFTNAAPLINPWVRLSNPLAYFDQHTVTLDLSCINAVEYRIAEGSSFVGIPFQTLPSGAATIDYVTSAGDGTKAITVQFRDAVGTVATATLPGGVLIDTQAPALTIDNPIDGSVISSSISIDATANDSAGIARVEFWIDGALVAQKTSAPYSYLWDATVVTDGTHTIKVSGFDAIGRRTDVTRTVSVQKLLHDVSGTVQSAMNIYGAGHATAPGGGALPFKYIFPAASGQQFRFTSVAGTVTGGGISVDADGGGAASKWSTSELSGLSGIATTTKSIYLAGVFLDDTEPSGTAPVGLDFSGNINFTTLAPQLRQVFFIGDGLTGTGAGDVQVFAAPPTATRLYLGFVDACSSGGAAGCYNDNSGQVDVSFTRQTPVASDTSGPDITNVMLAEAALTNGTIVSRTSSISLLASDRSGVARVEILLDGSVIATPSGIGTYTSNFDLTSISNGSHTLAVRATDSLNNANTASFTITVAHAAPDAPVISTLSAGTTTRVAATAVSGTAKAGSSVQVYVNATAAGAAVIAGADGRFSTSVTLSAGSNQIQATVTDTYGTSALSVAQSITLDLTVPSSPTGLTATAQTQGKVRLAWTRSSDSNAIGYDVYRSASAFNAITEASKITGSPTNAAIYDDLPPIDGTWYYRVVAVNSVNTPSVPTAQAQAVSDATLPRAVSIIYTSLGKVDATSGALGQGIVNLALTVSEPLQATPYLSIVPQGGAPLPLELNKVTDTTYNGSFLIDSSTPSGIANALFSARDLVGNRGTDIDVGATLKIDTDGPALSGIVLTPASPIKNDATPIIQATFSYSKAPKSGATPVLTYLLSGPVRSRITLSGLTQLNATTWQANFTLPSDAGGSAPETLSFGSSAIDSLDNQSTKITAPNRFQVYQGSLPPLDVPLSFTAKAQPGGKVKLAWQTVTDAFSYQIYRQAPGQTELTPLIRVSGASYIDQTSADGAYKYAVATVRQSNGQESLSTQSAAVDVNASASAPGAPQNFTLQLTGQGIVARWQAPVASVVDSYNLYRSNGTSINSIEGLTPLRTGIKQLLALDPTPSPTQGAYVVTALDAAGNESALSNSTYLNASLLPVTNVQLMQIGSDLPVITWGAPNGSVAGYNIYVGPDASKVKLTPSPITSLSFTDSGYTSGERRYTIATVDASSVEMPRSVLLPNVASAIVAGLPVKRGIMNKLQVQVSNTSSSALDNVRVVVRLPINHEATAFQDHKSDVITLGANETKLVTVIVGGYADMPSSAQAQVGVEITPNEGEFIKLAHNENISVGDSALVVGMATDEFTRGATGKLKLTIENTSDVDIELLTATGNGNGDSTELRFKILDNDGNVLATQAYKQVFGANVVTLVNGLTVARIPAGTSYVSDTFNLNVPASSPNSIRVRLEVDKLRYHSGQDDQVIIDGHGSEKTVSLIDTAYYGEVTDVSPISSFGDKNIVITGRALDRKTSATLPNTRLKLILNQQGFERNFSVLTDASGSFTYTFTPTITDAGLYKVSAVHPDITDRPEQKAFTINRVTVGPTPYKLDIPRNYPFSIPFTAKAGAGTSATNLRLVMDAASQPTGMLPTGVNVQLSAPISIAEKQTLNVPVVFTANNDAQPSGGLILNVFSDEHPEGPIGQVIVNYTLSEAKPFLITTPSFVETGLAQGGSQVESVVVANQGLQDALNLQFTLTKPDGGVAPSWVSIASAANGALAIGAKRSIDLSFTPPAGTAEGVYEFRLKVQGDNVPEQSLNVYASVTQSGQGNVLFKTSDIFTATVDKNGKLIPGLANATITLQNEDVITVTQELVTDSLGEALFQNVPAGRYKFRARASNHQEIGGRLQIKPGITLNQPVFLDYNVITVEWSVREITIQDRYEVTLNATFETDVPTAVVVLQPASINLPKMNAGEVYYGELTLTNYGLVRADHVAQSLPQNDANFRYEFLVDVPSSLDAKQRVTIPYRVIAVQSLEAASSSGTASGGGCYSYSKQMSVAYDSKCANGVVTPGGTSASWFSVSNSSCVTGGGTSSGGSSGGWSGPVGSWLPGGGKSTPLPGTKQKCVALPIGVGGATPPSGSGYGNSSSQGSLGPNLNGSDGQSCPAN